MAQNNVPESAHIFSHLLSQALKFATKEFEINNCVRAVDVYKRQLIHLLNTQYILIKAKCVQHRIDN